MIGAILAFTPGGGIGNENKLPWGKPFPEDMKWFKQKTEGQVVVMGRSTWDSIGKKLPNRVNVVFTNKPETLNIAPDKILSGKASEDLRQLQREYPDKEILIIGGKNLIEQAWALIEVFHTTVVEGSYTCDTFVDISRLHRDFNMVLEYNDYGNRTTPLFFETGFRRNEDDI